MRDRKNKTIKVSEWILPMLLYVIPGVNILAMLYYMLLGQNVTKRNWAKCALVILALGYFFCIIFIVRINNMTYAEFYDFVHKLSGK